MDYHRRFLKRYFSLSLGVIDVKLWHNDPGASIPRKRPLQKRLCMDASVWERKTPEQQKTHYERLLTTPVLTADNVVVSSDGREVCRFAPDGDKKKNQTKRKINARTTTVNKKQRH